MILRHRRSEFHAMAVLGNNEFWATERCEGKPGDECSEGVEAISINREVKLWKTANVLPYDQKGLDCSVLQNLWLLSMKQD